MKKETYKFYYVAPGPDKSTANSFWIESILKKDILGNIYFHLIEERKYDAKFSGDNTDWYVGWHLVKADTKELMKWAKRISKKEAFALLL